MKEIIAALFSPAPTKQNLHKALLEAYHATFSDDFPFLEKCSGKILPAKKGKRLETERVREFTIIQKNYRIVISCSITTSCNTIERITKKRYTGKGTVHKPNGEKFSRTVVVDLTDHGFRILS